MKKVGYIFLLIVIIAAITLFFIFNSKINYNKNQNNNVNQVIGTRSLDDNNKTSNSESKKETIKKELDDGVLYTLSDNEIKADIVLKDNYYDTQIKDIMYNFDTYKGKVIEIEGMYLDMDPYTVVGRYSTNALCPYCPAGYSAFEYIWNGEKIKLENTTSWIKVIGTLCVGNDETSGYQDYYYIDAISVEVMNERGLDTVNN